MFSCTSAVTQQRHTNPTLPATMKTTIGVFVLFCIVIINANTLKSVGDNTADAAIGGKDDHVDKAHKVEDNVGSTKDTSGELPGIHDRVNRDVEDALDKTKETTGEAWDKTKETTGEALDKTKEKTGN